jgi:DNA-binding transcriptional regulator LsrR (DeoR family)
VIGMNLEQLRGVNRVVGVAGGRRKVAAIRAALIGRLINVLIADRATARALTAPHDAAPLGPDSRRAVWERAGAAP